MGKEDNEAQQGKIFKEILAKEGVSFGIYSSDTRDASRLEPYRREIELAGYAAIIQIMKEMQIGCVDIGVFDIPERTIPQLGIGGYAHGGKPKSRVEIDLDPESPHMENVMGAELRRTLRHELHHDIRFKHLGVDKTLRERLVTEGLAQWYEIEGTEEKPPIYSTALPAERVQSLLERAKTDFNSSDHDNWDEWFFGAPERSIPYWAGYSLGFHLVGNYLQANPNTRPSTLYGISAEEIIR